MKPEPLGSVIRRLLIVILFGIAFGYIEAAVVVYLRAIFHPEGFTFPLKIFDLNPLGRKLLLTEIGREASTIVLIITSAWLIGQDLRQKVAYFLVIFAIWDIFYYVWLKVLIDWPASVMDWDILFLIPIVWASPVLYPVLISVVLFAFALVILYRDARGRPLRITMLDWLCFFLASIVVVVCFCIAGDHVNEPDYKAYFYWPLFALGYVGAIAIFARCVLKSTCNG